ELPFGPASLGPKKVVGIEAVVATLARAPTAFESLAFTVAESYLAPSQDTVMLRASSEGKLKSGQIYRNQYLQVFTFRAAQVVRWIEFFDPQPALDLFAPRPSA